MKPPVAGSFPIRLGKVCPRALFNGKWFEYSNPVKLWPDDSIEEHGVEMVRFAESDWFVEFIVYNDINEPVGIVEADAAPPRLVLLKFLLPRS